MQSKFPSFPTIERFFLICGFFLQKSGYLHRRNCEKRLNPKGTVGSCGHLKLYGVSVLFLQVPSHIAAVLVVLIFRPDACLNLHSSFSRFDTEAWSLTNTVVSSANCESFISFLPMLTPLTELSFCKALARSSIPIMKRRPDRGLPCLTPQWS